jgi:nucleoside-diphosphate-sugar epimerase
MRVLILGGGGFLGRRLAKELIQNGGLAKGELSHLTLFDIAFDEDSLPDSRLEYIQADFSDEATITNICSSSRMLYFILQLLLAGRQKKILS